MRRAVFPGSFDPITLGHVDIIERALPLFDEIIIAIGINADKKYMYSLEARKRFIEETFADTPTVKVKTYTGLTVHFCKKEGAQFILRGLRNTTDLNYEQSIAQTNVAIAGIESVFLVSSPSVSNISSSIVRDVKRNNGDIRTLVPEAVI
ncbi:pantetheine-phosphate adenylyltransferase [Ulvibacter litoralis]|uniref:Phosphopantetheine adenylyltransferase n=1 Tax=Ulvibacter litoralis TaxID=227084 RepID=A0A1G7J0J6_9FLAO|nr:pantetheine-phosphate adenylyltransferase [Ulvibacter litoralis]GHC60308.1 phosphopantetheine adenylyltransferase [Ulvibacter litoralis]SDF18069.1 Phosphopantetheine adenylyltransferase [Ulvibacter litoralis]